jgi:cytolysin (calcineurin-like family phosphatase)
LSPKEQIVADAVAAIDASNIFMNDVDACRMGGGVNLQCEAEGKADHNMLRPVAALTGCVGSLRAQGRTSRRL